MLDSDIREYQQDQSELCGKQTHKISMRCPKLISDVNNLKPNFKCAAIKLQKQTILKLETQGFVS
jgi:hypothetical protein